MMDQKVGELNGIWALLMRVGLLAIIPSITLIGKMMIDNAVQARDIAALQSRQDAISAYIANLPPEEWRRRIIRLEDKFDALRAERPAQTKSQ